MEEQQHEFIKGRGAQFNPQNRFSRQAYEQGNYEQEEDWEAVRKQPTQILLDNSKNVVNKLNIPDVPLDYSINPYQGCEHGCIYCYARNTHEYWGYSAGIDFETKIIAKHNAAELLRKTFEKKIWKPAVISLSTNTDCYQPAERKLRLTRQILEVCLEYKNPVSVLTKNALVLRDMDVLQDLAAERLVQVASSITTTQESLRQVLEPRTSTIKTRLSIIETCAKHNIPTGVMFAPIIPGLNDQDMYEVLQKASDAGAYWAGYTIVRLNGAIEPIFKDWLQKAFPDRAEKVWHHIQSCHGGKVSDSRPGVRMRGEGEMATIIRQQFKLYCHKLGLNKTSFAYNMEAFRRPPKNGQLSLF
ncbi:radical SAM protein [Taibaiella sp. KBW10]|uniref:PA0069 family radical SAM protein n=1 Tax=Taibaiella sp. KBW10 TaxID=2153357 RepID=UPI000F5A4524|nr:PA0069 family radical SAM protein [Taibaiella sp. KBW10]RQO31895.1 radical SAM protein [Taibaiella sp. KBW10]